MLARHAGFDSALIIRGVEGGVIPSLRQPGRRPATTTTRGIRIDLDPTQIGIEQSARAVPLPDDLPKRERADDVAIAVDIKATAAAAAAAGLAALQGEKGATYDSLLLGASLILHHVGRAASFHAAPSRSAPRWIPAAPQAESSDGLDQRRQGR